MSIQIHFAATFILLCSCRSERSEESLALSGT